VSSATGIYAVPFLPPGNYGLRVAHPGFKNWQYSNLTLGTDEAKELNIALEVGAVSETLTVTAEAPVLESTTSDVGQLIEAKTVSEMPLNGRRALSLVALSGAAVWVSYGGEAKPNFSLAGGRVQSQMFWLDGGTGQNMRLGVGQVDIDPPVEVIREFRVVQNTYSAEFGGSAGGLIISTTKSGTNQLHGSGFEYFRNDKLDARNFFSADAPPLRYNLFGGTIGGPIRRNKTHFFVGYEATRKSTGDVDILTVPTAEQRRGDFSRTTNAAGNLIRIFDPATNRVAGGKNVRDPFAGNMIPAARLDPVAVKVMGYYPLPNRVPSNPAGANNFGKNYSQIFRRDNLTARLDQAFSDRNHFYFRYIYNRDPLTSTSVFPDPIVNTRNSNQRDQSIYLLSDTHTVTPAVITDVRFSFSDRTFHNVSAGLGTNAANLLGLKGVPAGAFPAFTTAGISSLGSTSQERIQMPIRQNQFVNSWTWVRGNHVVKFGGEYRRSRNIDVQRPALSGQFSFATQPTALEGTANTGLALASLLIGFPNSYAQRSTDPLDRSSNYLAAYLQDDWKIARGLTLNLGLRWETDTPIIDANDRMNGFDTRAINPVSGTPGVVTFAGVNGWPRSAFEGDWNNFGPRFGFAWQPGSTQKTVVRGGAGLFFAHPFDHGVPNLTSLGFEQSLSLSSPDNGVTAPFLLRDGVPAVQIQDQPHDSRYGAVPVGKNATTNVQFFERNRRIGYSQQFNLGIQHEFGAGLVAEATFVGNLSRKLSMANLNINQIPPAQIAAIQRAGVFRQAYRPYPQFNGVTLVQPGFGVTDYCAGMLKLERRFSRGLSLLATYTWSKNLANIDDNAGDLGDAQQYSDYYNRRLDKGPDGLDIEHRFTWSSVYELPLGKGRRWMRNGVFSRIAGGWTIGAIGTVQTGGPFTVTTQTNTTNVFSAGAQRADLLRNPSLPASERTPERWFDAAAFAVPQPFTFGTAGRGILRADGRVNFDFSLLKNFNLTESRFVQFRAETFNGFNHANFGLPGRALGGPGFGIVSDATDARILQLGIRIVF
jgi:hypothetical protein